MALETDVSLDPLFLDELLRAHDIDETTLAFADDRGLTVTPQPPVSPTLSRESDSDEWSAILALVGGNRDGEDDTDILLELQSSQATSADATVPAVLPFPVPARLFSFAPRSPAPLPVRPHPDPCSNLLSPIRQTDKLLSDWKSPEKPKRPVPSNPSISPVLTPVITSAVADSLTTTAVKCLMSIRNRMNPTGWEVVEVWKGLAGDRTSDISARVATIALSFKAQKKYTVRKLSIGLLHYFCESDPDVAEAVARNPSARKKRKHSQTVVKERFIRDVLGVGEHLCPHFSEGKMLVDHSMALLEAMKTFKVDALHIPDMALPTQRCRKKKPESSNVRESEEEGLVDATV
jgi:hypothetical protein